MRKLTILLLLFIGSKSFAQTNPATTPPVNPQPMTTNTVYQEALTKKYFVFNGSTFGWRNLTDSIQVQRMINRVIGASYNFSNGLTNDGSGNVKLGGTITEATFLNSATSPIFMGDLSGQTATFGLFTGATAAASMGINNGTRTSFLTLGGSSSSMSLGQATITNTQPQGFVIDNSGKFYVQDARFNKGLVYNANYATNGTADDRWIPDWGAVKNLVTGNGVTASNGLNKNVNDIQLGGDITDDININNPDSKNFYINGGSAGGEIKFSFSTGSYSLVDGDQAKIGYNAGKYLQFTSEAIRINDDQLSKGAVYNSDYSANGKLDNRWIPDWGAVKSIIPDVTGYVPYTGADQTLDVGNNIIYAQNFMSHHGGGFITEGGDNSTGSLIGGQLALNSIAINTYDPGLSPSGDGTSLKVSNTSGKLFSFDSDGNIRRGKDAATVLWSNIPLVTPKDSLIVTLSDTTSLKSYNGASINAFVTDTTGTGGNFKYVSNITKNDGGKYFPATGKGSGTWVRDAPRKYYNLAWYGFDRTGVRNDSLKFANLVTSIDSGSTVYAQTGRYNFNIKLSKSIHLIGEKQPLYNGSRLIDGTIILGFIDFVNHFGASVSTLGIDQHAANPFFTNGLMNNSSDQGTVTTRELQQKISNITLLGRGYLAADAFKTSQHAIYISSGKHIDLENISIFRYNQGIAVKAPYTNVTNVHGEDNNTDLIIVKADDLHLDVGGINVTNVTGIADTAGTAVSVYAQASAGGNLHDVNFTAINLTATASADAGFYAQGLNTGTKMSGINFTNVTSTGSNVTGFYASQSSGAIVKDVNFTNAIATNSTGSAFKVLSANYINFNNAHAINSGNYSFENQGGTNIQVNSGVSTTPVAGDYSGTFIKNSINDFQYIGGKLKVGGGNTAEAKLHVDENTAVGANAGDSQILTSFWSKPGTNVFQERNWLIRKTAGTNYTGDALHNGIGTDGTGSTPTTDRVWIERHPFNQTIAFGSVATTFLTLSPTSLNTSIPLVLQNGSATGAATIGADVNAMTITPNTRHLGRLATLAYDGTSPVNLITGDNNVSTNIIGIGSGTSGYAPTSVQTFAAANNTTLGGTQITNVNTSGFQVLSGAINVTGLTASQLVTTDASKNLVSTTALPSGTTATTPTVSTTGTAVINQAYLPTAAPSILATITGINTKTTGSTALYTVPAGKTLIVTGVYLKCTAATAITAAAQADVGVTAASVYTSANIAMTTAVQSYQFPVGGVMTPPTTGQVLNLNINTAATGTSQTIMAVVVGFLF